MRALSIILFATVATSLLAAGHYYVWRRLARSTDLAKLPRRIVAALLTAAGLFLPTAWLLGRFVPRDHLGWAAVIAFCWMGFLFYTVLLLGAWDVGRGLRRATGWLRRRFARPTPRSAPEAAQPLEERAPTEPTTALASPERRAFLSRVVGGGAVLGAGGLTGLGMASALGDVETPEVPVRLERLPAALSGFRIALLTDIHVGPIIGGDFVERVVARTNRLRPDLVAITGDLVDGSVANLSHEVAALRKLRATYGVYFVTGNHEYYSGAADWVAFLPRLGIHVLRNERVSVGDRGPGGASFDLAGVPDPHGARFLPDHVQDFTRLSAGRDEERELVMLAHRPSQVWDAARAGVGLQLSGHTHGGQIWPFGALTQLAEPYLSGLHRHGDRTQIYVSRGTGFWGPPMRVMAPPEISLIVLESA